VIQNSCCATRTTEARVRPVHRANWTALPALLSHIHKHIHAQTTYTTATHDPLRCTTSQSADIRYSGLALKVIRSLPGLCAALPNSAACDTSSGAFYPHSDMSRTVQAIHSILCWHYKSALNLIRLTLAQAGSCPCARHESLWGSGSITEHINFGILDRVKWWVTPGPLPAGNDLRYPLNRKLDELQIRSGEGKNQPNAAVDKTTI